VGEGRLAAGEEGVGGAGCGAGGGLGEEGGLFVGLDGVFLLLFECFGVFLLVHGIFGGGGFDVVGAVEEFGAEGEGEGV
jgi:hypothetical protein